MREFPSAAKPYLAGVNDDPGTLQRLFHGLLKVRVKPYYLYQCDPVVGTSHFRVPVGKGLELIRALQGFTTGYAVPSFVIDAPGGGGKIPLLPNQRLERSGDQILLENFQGKIIPYPDPQPPRLTTIALRELEPESSAENLVREIRA